MTTRYFAIFLAARSKALHRRGPRVPIEMALGSGVIVQPDGTILTNHHVIDGAEQIKVELTNHRVFDAKVVGSDPPSDLAMLKINGKNLPALTLGDSDFSASSSFAFSHYARLPAVSCIASCLLIRHRPLLPSSWCTVW